VARPRIATSCEYIILTVGWWTAVIGDVQARWMTGLGFHGPDSLVRLMPCGYFSSLHAISGRVEVIYLVQSPDPLPSYVLGYALTGR
jgi:hypothetical protein